MAILVPRSGELLGEPDENAFGASDVAESIDALVLDDFVYELRSVLAEVGEHLVEIVDFEHDPEVAERVRRRVSVIFGRWRLDVAREFNPAAAVRHAHHCDLDALAVKAGDTSRPLAFDHRSPFELEAELGEEGDRVVE